MLKFCGLLILWICALHAGFSKGACANSSVYAIDLNISSIQYTQAYAVNVNPILVRTLTSEGQFFDGIQPETVTVSLSGGGPLGGTLTQSTTNGVVSFSGLQLLNYPAAGEHFLNFSLCNGLFYAAQRILISSTPVRIGWVQQPLIEITSSGIFVVKPKFAFFDALSNITLIPNTNYQWELEAELSDGTPVPLFHATINGVSSGNITSFDDLRASLFNQTAIGQTLTLKLKRYGDMHSTNSSYTFPSPVAGIKIIDCTNDFLHHPPTGINASRAHWNLQKGQAISIKGVYFDPAIEADLRCKYGGLVYPVTRLNLCLITCNIPTATPANTGMWLEVSMNAGFYYENVSLVRILENPPYMLVPQHTNITAWQEDTIVVNNIIQLQDSLGNNVGLHGDGILLNCTTKSIDAMKKRVNSSSTYLSPMWNYYATPDDNPTVVEGTANFTLAFVERDDGPLFAEIHTYCCGSNFSGSALIPTCFDIFVRADCPTSPRVLSVSSSGCQQYPNGSLYNCKTQGSYEVLVEGNNFGYSGARLRIGQYFCDSTVHDSEFPTRFLRAYGCKGKSGSAHNQVIIFMPKNYLGMWQDRTYSFSHIPNITSIRGCGADLYPSTARCAIDGNSTVNIVGHHFGSSGAKVHFYYKVPLGMITRITAAQVTHLNTEGTSINATGFPGEGSNFEVAVEAAWGEIGRAQFVTMSFTATVQITCPSRNGVQCGAKGNCDTSTGNCVCFNDTVNGFWTGMTCEACVYTFFGESCKNQCPGGWIPCGGAMRGTCDEGVNGTGICACKTGYGGIACQSECPGGVASPCSFRGTCLQGVDPPICLCTQSNITGFWGGITCTSCATNYIGASCQQECPTYYLYPGESCSGHGTCSPTGTGAVCTCAENYCGNACQFSGADCGVCDFGRWGAGCANLCAGFSSSPLQVCSGNGRCSEGVQGTGQCVCEAGYAGSGCDVLCPISSGIICSGHGTCLMTTGLCQCDVDYGLSDCSKPCPGLENATICNGRGQCNSGANGDASCSCFQGYAGVNCEVDCTGGIETPCNLRGVCNIDGSCTCYSNVTHGYWQGAACAECQDDWYGPNCNGTCVMVNGYQCANHGKCTASLQCVCHANIGEGFWAEPDCGECKPYYFGAACRRQCPGGACNPCSGHGTCDDGVSGTGLCTCFSNGTHGHFVGSKCDECAPSHYDLQCYLSCPSAFGIVCGGHGVCSDGMRGTGLCTCDYGIDTGYYGGSACGACRSGYFGADCNSSCPGTNENFTCNGNGVCDDGIEGSGLCTCAWSYGKEDCSSKCPEASSFVLCSANGDCVDGECVCYNSSTTGYWQGEGCENCIYGFYGISCSRECPKVDGEICAGHGECSHGVNGTGECLCDEGYAGVNCTLECSGGTESPCNNHGTCNQNDGSCTCQADATLGYWDGSACEYCNELYNSTNCVIKCPTDPANPDDPCNGHGKCFDGACLCDMGWCGEACDESETCHMCPEGRYGANCEYVCPGGGTCSNHGFCNTNLGSATLGQCTCDAGYWRYDCSGVCPRDSETDKVCAGHGSCLKDKGTCQCNPGYSTATCSKLCPGFDGVSAVCSAKGTCVDGACTCNSGYAGRDCSTQCPGGSANPCHGHGTCIQDPPSCNCFSDGTDGYWTGDSCSSCISGNYGSDCLSICVHGNTVGTDCICDPGWSDGACTEPCPAASSIYGVCTGHGTCLSNHTLSRGLCICDQGYFTEDCSIYCTPDKCKAQPWYLTNGECNTETGQCSCIDNDEDGHWADPATRCTTCKLFWYGEKCELRCPCNNKGSCDKDSGTCQCFSNDNDGFYDGVACERCKEGYIGTGCKSKDVAISRQAPCSSVTEIRDTSSFSIIDTMYDVILTGARPVIVCNMTTKLWIASIDLGGSVISGRILPDGKHFFLSLTKLADQADTLGMKNVLIKREDWNTLKITKNGSVWFPTQVRSTRRRRAETTERKLLAAHVYTTVTLVETLILSTEGDGETLMVMSNGIVQRVVGVDVVEERRFDEYFTQLNSAAITSTKLISPARLLLAGFLGSEWQLIAVSLETFKDVEVISSTVNAKSIFCANTTGISSCRAAAKVISDGTYVVLAILTSNSNGDGVGIMRFRYTQLEGNLRVESNTILENYEIGTFFNVTAMILDPLSGAGFVAINLENTIQKEPTTIYKFDLLSLQVYGTARFQKIVESYEIVTSFSVNNEDRTLFATVPLETQLNVVPLSLYAVTKIYPNVADTVGGTVITVEGEGFVNDDFLACDFNGTWVKAEFISSREALCIAPQGGDERCEGTPLEMAITGNQLTKNNILLRRVSSPRISSVFARRFESDRTDNAYGKIDGGEIVVLDGFGFQNSSMIACKFSSTDRKEQRIAQFADRDYAYSDGKQGVRFFQARLVNSTRMECIQPKFDEPTRGVATVEVTLDGNVYSRSEKEYQVIGPATGIKAFKFANDKWEKGFDDKYTSSERVDVQQFSIFVVDIEDQRLRNLDPAVRKVSLALTQFQVQILGGGSGNLENISDTWNCLYPPTERFYPVFYTTGQTVANTLNGRVDFSGGYLLRPPAGDYLLTFTDHTTGWTYNHNLRVDVGAPYRLRICREPPEALDNLQPTLSIQPRLYVEDFSANQLPGASLVALGIRVEANYIMEWTETVAVNPIDNQERRLLGVPVLVKLGLQNESRLAQLRDDFLQFEGIEMRGIYGKVYNIRFSSEGLIGIISRDIHVKWCNNNTDRWLNDMTTPLYFAKLGSSECFLCPDGAMCDGTPNILLTRNNLWRPSNDSYKYYSCEKPFGSDSCRKPFGECVEGYEGPRCSVCALGYGRDGDVCIKCRTPGQIAALMALFIVITVTFVGILVYTSFTTEMSDTLPVLIKIGINHLQVASRINEIIVMPQALTDLFKAAMNFSELIRFDIVSSECPPLNLTVYGRFFFVVGMPCITMVVFAGVFLILYFYRELSGTQREYEPPQVTDASRNVRRDRVMMTVAKFMARMKGLVRGDIDRDDEVQQYYSAWQYFGASCIITLCLVYPSVLQWCATMWKCDDIIYGDANTRHIVSYLTIDRSIVCTDPMHRKIQIISIIAALVYGVGVPLFAMFLVHTHWKIHGRAHVRKLYAFLCAGYAIETWWWEATVMVRKALIVFIIIFVKEHILRTYFAMWTMTLALGAHSYMQPFDPRRPSLYYFEGIGITTIVVTLNLSLLFQFDMFDEDTSWFQILVMFLFGINILVFIVFVYFICRAIYWRVRKWWTARSGKEPPEEKATYKSTEPGKERPDRFDVQKQGLIGLLRREARVKTAKEEEEEEMAAQLPPKQNETPYERVARLHEEMRKKDDRKKNIKSEVELEKELDDLHEQMMHSQALAAAEEAAIERAPTLAEERAKHEDEILRIMDEIRKERSQMSAKAADQAAFAEDVVSEEQLVAQEAQIQSSGEK